MTPLNDALTAALALVTVIAVLSPYVAGLPWVKKRPGLENFINGAGNLAARIKNLIPIGSTPQQAEAIVAANMAPFLSEYSDSAKAAKLTDVQKSNIVMSQVMKALPPGHIAPPTATPADDVIVQKVMDRIQAQNTMRAVGLDAQTLAAPKPAPAMSPAPPGT
jgi:hypothetical protein